MSKVGVVILNFNGSEQTIKFVKNLQEVENNEESVIILVDNNSNYIERNKLVSFATDNNYTLVPEKTLIRNEGFKNSKKFLVLSENNYGYAKGNNLGLILANYLDLKYTLITNNDIVMIEPVIQKLIKEIETDDKVAIIGPKIIDDKGNVQGPFKKTSFANEFWYNLLFPIVYLMNKIFHTEIFNTRDYSKYPYRLMGCYMLCKTELLDKVGFFDENTFLYAEEMILSEKLLQEGYLCKYDDTITVKHIHGYTTNKIKAKEKFLINLASDCYYFRNYLQYSRIKITLIKFAKYYNFLLISIIKRIKIIIKEN